MVANASERSFRAEKALRGGSLLALAAAKGVLLVGPCGRLAATCFAAGSLGVLEAWYGAAALALQIHFALSAAKDAVVGLGLLLGLPLARRGIGAGLPVRVRALLAVAFVLLAWLVLRGPGPAAALRYAGAMLGIGSPQAGAALLRGLLYAPCSLAGMALAAAWAAWAWFTRGHPERGSRARAAWAFVVLALAIAVQLPRPPALRAELAERLRCSVGDALIGLDGWLVSRQEVAHLSGPGCAAPSSAVLQFGRQLRAQGADLVVVPVPGKAAVYPERLAGGRPRAPRQGVLRNPGFGALVREMRAAGIRVFDTGPTLARAAAAGEEVFLRTDTRWSPAGMTVVARALAQFLAENVDLTESPLAVYHLGEAGLPNTGNLAAALGLPVGRALTEPEIVTTRPVLTDDGALWPPRHDARVLVLGDDLCAIYSDTALGWGEGAGLVEHLGYHLGRPVDGVAAAEGGLSAAWAKAGRERLAGKSVVVCVFADEALSSSGGTTSVSSAGGNP